MQTYNSEHNDELINLDKDEVESKPLAEIDLAEFDEVALRKAVAVHGKLSSSRFQELSCGAKMVKKETVLEASKSGNWLTDLDHLPNSAMELSGMGFTEEGEVS